MCTIYPWQQSQWNYLSSCRAQGMLSHALLLTGAEGLGKADFARAFAALLLCHNSGVTACGQCAACQLLQANNHPDLLLIQPEEKDKAIKVDQIREVICDLGKTSQQGGYQVVIINPADAMNISAANALLKTLEEPAANVQMVLISNRDSFLPATIRSRCQQLAFQSPTRVIAKEWLGQYLGVADNLDLLLNLADGAPLKALSLVRTKTVQQREQFSRSFFNFSFGMGSALSFAEECLEYPLAFVLGNFLSFLSDLLKLQLGSDTAIINFDSRDQLQQLASKLSVANVLTLTDKVVELVSLNNKKININKQIALEALWIEFGKLV